ncbi:ABC transporter substrate-binding protein [Caulobacter sp. UC70_42]|uniref:ABC transporter substrate-binding protein n=1 Tax=Caulobacter sp. UC70_42 TaxID=3374551 RepID=UPI003757CCEE
MSGALAMTAGAPPPRPRRIVSLNSCLDAMLVHLADRGQIAALSHYARDARASTVADQARTLPYTWESAEEVIDLMPDLVLASQHSALATRNALKRLHVPVQRFKVPRSIDESLLQVREVARLIGHPDRGEALVARIGAAIAAARPAPGARRLTALIYQPNGFAAGPGTLVDEMMAETGFDNVARRFGLKTWAMSGWSACWPIRPRCCWSASRRPARAAGRTGSCPIRLSRSYPGECVRCGCPKGSSIAAARC